MLWTLAGAAVGVVLAAPVSYVLQPGIVRGMYNLREYCAKVVESVPHAWDGETDLLGCGHRVVVTTAIMGMLGGYAGFWLGPRRRRHRH
jgi:hypothetical protein